MIVDIGAEAAQLACLYAKGDRIAGDNLATHLNRILNRKLRRYGIAAQEIDDLAQSCVLEVLRRIHEFDSGRGGLDAWVGGFASNAAKQFWRIEFDRKRSLIPIEEISDMCNETQIESAERGAIESALGSLNAFDAELISMRFALQMSSEEIASASNLNAAQARKRISRAVERLRRHPAMRELLASSV